MLLATSLYGAGVSADAAKNMSTAESLLAGRGFFDHAGGALVYWPPLYPLAAGGVECPDRLGCVRIWLVFQCAGDGGERVFGGMAGL